MPGFKTRKRKAKALNEKGASVDVNEDGQVVDKRQLLRGGLNLDLKKKSGLSCRKLLLDGFSRTWNQSSSIMAGVRTSLPLSVVAITG